MTLMLSDEHFPPERVSDAMLRKGQASPAVGPEAGFDVRAVDLRQSGLHKRVWKEIREVCEEIRERER